MHEDHQAKIFNLNFKNSIVPMFMLFWSPTHAQCMIKIL
jgi:hypothetical protein